MLVFEDQFTIEKGVEYLIKLTHLVQLKIKIYRGKKRRAKSKGVFILVHSAGKLPRLQEFDPSGDKEALNFPKFIKLYGQLYPDKKLKIVCMR
jgi:hypothetical protein